MAKIQVVYIDNKGQRSEPIDITAISEDVRPTIEKMVVLSDGSDSGIGTLANVLKPKNKEEKGFTSLKVLYGPAKVDKIGVKALRNVCPEIQSYVGLGGSSADLGTIRSNGFVFDGDAPKGAGAYAKIKDDESTLESVQGDYQRLVVDNGSGEPSYVLSFIVNEAQTAKTTGSMPGPLRKEAELAKQREKQASDVNLILNTVNIISDNLNSMNEKGVKIANESELLKQIMEYFAENRGLSKEEAEKIASDTLREIEGKFTALTDKMDGLATKSDIENSLSDAIKANNPETTKIIAEELRKILTPTAEGDSLTIVDTLTGFVQSEEFKQVVTSSVPVGDIVENVTSNVQNISNDLAIQISNEMKSMGLATGADVETLKTTINNGFALSQRRIWGVEKKIDETTTTLGEAIDVVSQNVLALTENGVTLTEEQQRNLRTMIRREVVNAVTNSATGVKAQIKETETSILNGLSEAKAQADEKLDELLAGQGLILEGQQNGFATVETKIDGISENVVGIGSKVDTVETKVSEMGDTLGAIADTTKSTNDIARKAEGTIGEIAKTTEETSKTVGETDKKVDELSANLEGFAKKAEDAKNEVGERLKVLEGAVQGLLQEKDKIIGVLVEELIRANREAEEARKEAIEAQKQTIDVLEKGKNETIAIIKERDDKAMDEVKGLVALMDKQNERYVGSLQGFVEITARAMQSTQQTVSTQGNSAQSGQPTNISVIVNGDTEQRTQGTTTGTVQQGGITIGGTTNTTGDVTIGGTTNTTGNTSNDARISQLENKVDGLIAEIHALANKIGGQTAQGQGENDKKTPTGETTQPQHKEKEDTSKKPEPPKPEPKKPEPKKPEPNREEPKKPEPPKIKQVKVLRTEAKLAEMLKEPKLPWYKRLGKFIMRHPFRSMLIGLGIGAVVATGVGAIALGGLAPALATANAFAPTIAIGAAGGAGLGLIGSVASRISRKGRRERAYTKFMKKYHKSLKKLEKVEKKDAQIAELNAEIDDLRAKHRSGTLLSKVGVYKACRGIKRRVLRSKQRKLDKDILKYSKSVDKADKAKSRLNKLEDKGHTTNAVGGYLAKRNKIYAKTAMGKLSPKESEEDLEDLDYDLAGLYGKKQETSITEVSGTYKTGDAEMANLIDHFANKKTIKNRVAPSHKANATMDAIKKRNMKVVEFERVEDVFAPVTDEEMEKAKGDKEMLHKLHLRASLVASQKEAAKRYMQKHPEDTAGKEM